MKLTPASAIIIATCCCLSIHAADDAKKVTFVDDILPILENKCLNCHNPDEAKGGLDLSSYASMLAGGSGGDVVTSEDPGASRLYTLMSQTEEPFMPPKKPKAPDTELKLIADWINGGILETKNSKARKSDKPKLDMSTITSTGKPEGPPPMPEHLILQPDVITERPTSVPALAHSPWAPILAVAGQKQVLLYHSKDFDLLGVLSYPEGFPQTLSFSTNGSYLSCGGGRGGKSGNVVAWDIKTGERVIEVGKEFDIVLGADISPDLKKVVLGGPGRNIKIWDTVAGEQVNSIKKHPDWMLTAAFSPDGVIFATGGRNGGLYVWESATGYEFYTLKGHTKAVTDVAWRPDGNILASCSEDGQVMLWEMNEGKEVKKWAAHSTGVLAIDFAPNGNIATVGRDKTLKLWKADGTAIKTINASTDIVMSVAFSEDSKRVFSGDWTGTIKAWDAETGAELASIAPNPPSIDQQLAYSQKRISELTSTIPKLEQGVKVVSTELAAARTKQAEVNKANAEAAANAAKAKASVAQFDGQVKALTGQVKTAQDAVNAENAEVKKQTDAIAAHNKNLVAQKAELTKRAAELANREKAVQTTLAALNTAKAAPVPALTPDQAKALAAANTTRTASDQAKKAADALVAAKTKVQQDQTNQLNAARPAQTNANNALKQHQGVAAAAKQKADAAAAAKAQADAKLAESSKDGAVPPPAVVQAQQLAAQAHQQAVAALTTANNAVTQATKVAQAENAKIQQIEAALTKTNQELVAARADQTAKNTALAQADAALKPLRDAEAAVKAAAEKLMADINTKTVAFQNAEKSRNAYKVEHDKYAAAVADTQKKVTDTQTTLTAAQAAAKAATDDLAAKNKAMADAKTQLVAAQADSKKYEALVANGANQKKAADDAVAAVMKKEADAKKSFEVAKSDLKTSQFLVKKWQAAAINLTAREEAEEMEDMTIELEDMMEEETEKKDGVKKATEARVSAEKTLADAKKTVNEGTQKLASTSSSVLERALQLVSSRAVAQLREEVISDVHPDPEAGDAPVEGATEVAKADLPRPVISLTDEVAEDDMDEIEVEEKKVEKVAVETLAAKSPDDIAKEIESLRQRLVDLEGFLKTSYVEADKTKETVVKASEVAAKTPDVIANRSKEEQAAAKALMDAEAERKRQEAALADQKALIDELKKKYLGSLPKREE